TLVLSPIQEQVSDVSELNIENGDVLLVTGGGRGITFKCLEAICKQSKPKVAILGIEDISNLSSDQLKLSDDELKDKKQQMIEELKLKEERVTPVLIERNWNQFVFNLEVLRNLQTLKEMGIEAEYFRTDVTKTKDVEIVIKKIEQIFKSHITHIIHGAGLEESKQFKKKKFGFSRLIVAVKVEGIWNVLNALDKKKLKRLVCFTSIAGRFGNPGQVDYSFANGYLSRLCWMLDQKGISSIACDWSAWGGIGMATRGSILQILKAQGIEPIPLERGIQTFVDLFFDKDNREVVVSCGLGPFDKIESSSRNLKSNKYPMIHTVEYTKPVFRADYTITTQGDFYMSDHQIQGTPIFPGVMGLELFAEMYSLVERKEPNIFKDVEFKAAIKQRKDKSKEIYVEYNASQKTMKLKSDFVPKIDEKRIIETEHFKATVDSSKRKLSRKKKAISINESKIELLTKEDIYSIFFHGSSFQVLEKLVELSGVKAITKVNIPKEKLFAVSKYKEQIRPLTIEAAFQTAGLYDYIVNQKTSLPSKIEQVKIFSNNSPKYVISEFITMDDSFSYYNIDVIDDKGDVIVRLERLALIHTQFSFKIDADMLNKQTQLKEYWEISSTFEENEMNVVPIKKVTNYLSNKPEEVMGFLSTQEKADFDKIKNEKRRIEYLSGVIATKELYSAIQEDSSISQEIEVRKLSKGQPYIFDKRKGKKSKLHLSISHSGDFAISTLSKRPVGIDIEKIETRNESFYKEAFTEKERDVISNDKDLGTIYWTIKEAISKALGEGLHINLKDVEVTFDKKSKNFKVDFSNEAKESLPFGSNSFKLKNKTSTNYSISLCEIEKRSKKNESRRT
ncbi:MAG: SDR family NAD(P)-dependent oxidoreductase, partial [Candidatus Heimdallarchaeota archaeon]|nr:SDR family NAD(P)-dependent oxidoreductase [Candidatus Heimdallarchaeota archaeon]MCK4954799.1 SDR family NAD(P)-dependent oxidoreductase [Candidatus Heimdallarchaeota archaeon]